MLLGIWGKAAWRRFEMALRTDCGAESAEAGLLARVTALEAELAARDAQLAAANDRVARLQAAVEALERDQRGAEEQRRRAEAQLAEVQMQAEVLRADGPARPRTPEQRQAEGRPPVTGGLPVSLPLTVWFCPAHFGDICGWSPALC